MPRRAMASVGRPKMLWSLKRISPELGASAPAMASSRVDLPAPFGPTTLTISPSATFKVTPRSALTGP